jgi:hypothetical protein
MSVLARALDLASRRSDQIELRCHIQSYELVVPAFYHQALSNEAILVIAARLGYLGKAAETVAVLGGVSRCSLQGVSCCALYAVRTGQY